MKEKEREREKVGVREFKSMGDIAIKQA